jgi:tRNA1Val (adenine37-N6)-methyltransferase
VSLITTQGHLLDGRLRYAQPSAGFRSGIEPVLLAASIPAGPGNRVIEAGTGAGAALLCLAARVPGLRGIGIERNAELAELAQTNAMANGMADLVFRAADIAVVDAGIAEFHHAFANPPYHAAPGSVSPITARATAKQAEAGLFEVWAICLGRTLRHRGTLTFIVPVIAIPACLAAMAAASCKPEALLPLWPHHGRAAKLVLMRGIKNGRGALRLLPGLILHEANGEFTPQAETILRNGAALPV